MALEAAGGERDCVGSVDHHALHAEVGQHVRKRDPCGVLGHSFDLIGHHETEGMTERDSERERQQERERERG